MSELWRSSLKRVQSHFAGGTDTHSPVYVFLTEHARPETGWPATQWRSPCFATGFDQIPGPGDGLLTAVEMPDGTTGYKPFYMRGFVLSGDDGARRRFNQTAVDGWTAIESVVRVRKLVPCKYDISGGPAQPVSLWLMFIFRLAWEKVEGSTLRAKHFVREFVDGTTYTVDMETLERYQQPHDDWEFNFAGGGWHKNIGKRPNFIYSELHDAAAASVAAIDILLAETAPRSPRAAVSQDKGGGLKPVLHPNDVKILRALASTTTTQNQYGIEQNSGLSRRSISERLAKLRAAGLTHRPNGDRGGEAITDEGRAAIPSDALHAVG